MSACQKMADANLQQSDSLHLLEETFSADIKWKDHIETVARSSARQVIQLSNTILVIVEEHLKSILKTVSGTTNKRIKTQGLEADLSSDLSLTAQWGRKNQPVHIQCVENKTFNHRRSDTEPSPIVMKGCSLSKAPCLE